MENFLESSKIVRKFAMLHNEADSNIEFFQKSEVKGFYTYKKDFLKNLNEMNEYLNKENNTRTLHLHLNTDLEMIFENKLQYMNDDHYKKIFNIYLKYMEDFTKRMQTVENLLEPLESIIDNLKILNNAKESLLSTDELESSYIFSEKRLATINKKINAENERVNNVKKECKELVKDQDKLIQIIQNLEDLFTTMDLEALPQYRANMAINFVKETGKNDVLNFLNVKTVQDDILDKYVMTKGQKNEEVIIFKDGSIAFKKNGVYQSPEIKSGSYVQLSRDICQDVITFLLRKKPKLIEPFFNMMIKENYNIASAFVTINSSLKNEQILKNNGFDVLDKIKDFLNIKTKPEQGSEYTLEQLDDEIADIKRIHDVQVFSASIISTKYKHLYNEKIHYQMLSLVDLKVTKDELQDNIGKKMAGFKTPEDLNAALQKYINSLQDFDMESVLRKSNNCNAKVVLQNDDLLVLKINDFEASKLLGSGSWCISRSSNHFESYVNERNTHQFFVFDFTKEANDSESMIGITLDQWGERSAAHLKNDDYLSESNKIFKRFQKEIIINNLELFPKMSKELKEAYNIRDSDIHESKNVSSNKTKNAF